MDKLLHDLKRERFAALVLQCLLKEGYPVDYSKTCQRDSPLSLSTRGAGACVQSLTDWLLLLAPCHGELVESLVPDAGLVQPERVPRLFVKGIDDAVALLGYLFPGLVESGAHDCCFYQMVLYVKVVGSGVPLFFFFSRL